MESKTSGNEASVQNASGQPLKLSAGVWWLGATLALPWLNPFSAGPSAAVVPWLVTAACGVTLVIFRAWMTIELVAASWLLAASLSGVIGLLQYFGVAGVMSPWLNVTHVGEAYGNLRQRNQFATLMNIGTLALVWLSMVRIRPRLLAWVNTVGLLVAALLGVANAASLSRTGLVQLIMVAAMTLWWRGLRDSRSRRVLIVMAIAYAAASVALPWLIGLDPLASSAWARLRDGDAACASRLTLWSNVLHLIAQKPWTGWGWGELSFAHFITLYPGERFCDILDNAHNLPLHLAVSLGVPAAVLICGAALWLVWRARPWAETSPTRQLAWGVLTVIMLHSMLEYPLWYGPFQMAFALSLILLWRTPRGEAGTYAGQTVKSHENTQNMKLFSWSAPVSIAFLAPILIVFVAYTTWDYHRISQIYLAVEERAPAYRSNTLAKVQASWLFKDEVRFAEFTTIELTPANAAYVDVLGKRVLHFSPEARVVQKLVESANLLGRQDEALYFLQRFKRAYPAEFAAWASKRSG